MTQEIAEAGQTGETVPADGARELPTALESLEQRQKAEDEWLRTAALVDQDWRDRGEVLRAIHRDVRMVGNMLRDFGNRLEALEKAQKQDSGQVWDAWDSGG